MKNYVVHDRTGKIVSTGFCPDDVVELQNRGNDELTVLVTAKHYPDPEILELADGVLCERTPNGLRAVKNVDS